MASSRVCILPKGLQIAEPSTFLKLPHPRTSSPALFLLGADSKMYEVQAVTPDDKAKRSWFIGDSIVQDGRLFMLTPFDPLFILVAILLAAQAPMVKGGQPRSLPYSQLFEEASNLIKFPNEDDEDEDEPAGADVLTFGQLQVVKDLVPEICEVQDISDDLQAYKLCLTKTCLRLHQKVERLATEQVFSGTFPTLSRAMAHDCLQTEGTDEKVQLQGMQNLAIEVLANYLPTEVEKALRASYDFSLLKQHIESMKASQALVEQQHRPKESSGKSKDDKTKGPNKKKKAPAVSRGVKELEKVSKRGMKPLTTFFQKKS